jgi:hypothetical protein
MSSTDQAPQFTTAQYVEVPADSHALFTRGLIFGVGGALLGLFLYSAVGIITGLAIGYISLAVGYIVAKAILMGSRGRGGRRYQIAAIVLTYMSVSVSAIPIGIWQIIHKPDAAIRTTAAATTAGPTAIPVADSSSTPQMTTAPSEGPSAGGLAAALGSLFVLGLVSPFLELQSPGSGIIGLIILVVGLRIAWRLTAESAPAPAPTRE